MKEKQNALLLSFQPTANTDCQLYEEVILDVAAPLSIQITAVIAEAHGAGKPPSWTQVNPPEKRIDCFCWWVVCSVSINSECLPHDSSHKIVTIVIVKY